MDSAGRKGYENRRSARKAVGSAARPRKAGAICFRQLVSGLTNSMASNGADHSRQLSSVLGESGWAAMPNPPSRAHIVHDIACLAAERIRRFRHVERDVVAAGRADLDGVEAQHALAIDRERPARVSRRRDP